MKTTDIWINYGYGFSMSRIESKYINKKALISFIEDNIPKVYFDSMISECNPSSIEEYIAALFKVEWEPELGGEPGLAGILQEVLIAKTGLDFISTSNVYGEQFVIYQPKYPWQMKETDMGLTKESLDQLMVDVLLQFMISVPTDIFDFQSVFGSVADLDDDSDGNSIYEENDLD